MGDEGLDVGEQIAVCPFCGANELKASVPAPMMVTKGS